MDIANRYTVIREIAAGGMARVFLAKDQVLGRNVAIKMLHQYLLDNPHSIQRFENEAHAIAQLSHENVIKLYDYGANQKQERYLVMEYVDGKTITDLIAAYQPFPNLCLLEIMSQILSGLQAAHEKGIYHRDVKPSNIMIDLHGCVKVMDFGIAYLVSQGSITMTGTFVGSPNYISPEQAEGGTISGKSDVFSAGALMYECATGHCPFTCDNVHATLNAILKYDPVPAFQYNPHLLSEIGDLLLRCLRKLPGDRPSPTEAMALIESTGKSLGLSLGKRRLEKFFASPEEYRKEEEKELYHALCGQAREFSKKRKSIQSLKYYAQAEQFGTLSEGDRKIIERIHGGTVLRRIAISVLIIMALVAGALSLFEITRSTLASARQAKKTRIEKNQSDSSTLAINKAATDSVDAAAKSDTGSINDSAIGRIRARLIADTGKRQTANPLDSIELQAVKKAQTENIGYLKVRTSPPWSDIYLNDVLVGVFPKITLMPVPTGRHVLSIKNTRCRDTSEAITIAAGDTLIREIILVPMNK
jgi:tRNA A-37 threonylcarbamoyl transferase component Bud32